jgi:hypothetical protein
VNGCEFSRTVMCWLDPEIVLASARRASSHEPGWDSPSILRFKSSIVSSAKEGGLLESIIYFLQHFSISDSYVSLLSQTHTMESTLETAAWLKTVRFQGDILKPNASVAEGAATVFELTERDAVADILLSPINCLIGVLENYCVTWKKASQTRAEYGVNIFLQHSSPFEFLCFAERIVASSYGFHWEPSQEPESRVYNRYRASNVIGCPPFDSPVIEAARQSTRIMALETLRRL